MSTTLQLIAPTKITAYAVAFDDPASSDQVWDEQNSQFTAFNSADWSDYAISVQEVADYTRVYRGSWDPGKSGRFPVSFYKQLGSSPAKEDELLDGQEVIYSASDQSEVTLQLLDQTLGTVDGLSFQDFRKLVAAFGWNLNDVTDLGGGEREVEFRLKDGSTKAVTVRYKPADGQRTQSTVHI